MAGWGVEGKYNNEFHNFLVSRGQYGASVNSIMEWTL